MTVFFCSLCSGIFFHFRLFNKMWILIYTVFLMILCKTKFYFYHWVVNSSSWFILNLIMIRIIDFHFGKVLLWKMCHLYNLPDWCIWFVISYCALYSCFGHLMWTYYWWMQNWFWLAVKKYWTSRNICHFFQCFLLIRRQERYLACKLPATTITW